MPEDNEAFLNAPFKQLARTIRPRKKDGLPAPAAEEDSQLFLAAIGSLPEKVQGGKRPAGFLLTDLCGLPQMRKKSMPPKKPLPPKDSAKEPQRPGPAADDGNEAFLWAMRNAIPLKKKGRDVNPPPPEKKELAADEPAFGQLLDGNFEFTLSCSDEYLEGKVNGLDELIMNRLREGQLSPEAHLDMHGLNASQAFESLRGFMRGAWFKGMRVVLVVTGRGRNSPLGQSILRHKLQEWLTQEPFKRAVLAFCTAKPYDGGPGSIYVLLRKHRKKGPVHWDKYSADPDLY